MNILYTIDDKYVDQFKTSVYSLISHASGEEFDVYIMQKRALTRNKELEDFLQSLGATYHPVIIGEGHFEGAPQSDRYPELIYYRLLAQEFLSEDMEQILYLDADTLVINDIQPLFNIDMEDYLYLAATTAEIVEVKGKFNRLRLASDDLSVYYNSGMLMMNLNQIRQEVRREDIFSYIENH